MEKLEESKMWGIDRKLHGEGEMHAWSWEHREDLVLSIYMCRGRKQTGDHANGVKRKGL